MKAITVRQPWAWAIMRGGKDVENRTRNIVGSYRGPLVIHAAQRMDPESLDECAALSGYSVSSLIGVVVSSPMGELGAALGSVNLTDSHTDCFGRDIQRLAQLRRDDRAAYDALPDSGGGGVVGRARYCSTWAMDGCRHLVMSDPRPFAQPVPYRGRLGLWEFPDNLLPEGVPA